MSRQTANDDMRLKLKCCDSFEEFDVLLEGIGLKTDSDKIAYLQSLFDVNVVHATDDNRHIDYIAIAGAIMHIY